MYIQGNSLNSKTYVFIYFEPPGKCELNTSTMTPDRHRTESWNGRSIKTCSFYDVRIIYKILSGQSHWMEYYFFFLKEAKHDHYILTICSWFVPTFSPFGYVYLPKRFPSPTACSARVHSTPTRIFLSVALLLLLLYYQQPLSSPPRETITYVLR